MIICVLQSWVLIPYAFYQIQNLDPCKKKDKKPNCQVTMISDHDALYTFWNHASASALLASTSLYSILPSCTSVLLMFLGLVCRRRRRGGRLMFFCWFRLLRHLGLDCSFFLRNFDCHVTWHCVILLLVVLKYDLDLVKVPRERGPVVAASSVSAKRLASTALQTLLSKGCPLLVKRQNDS